MHSASSTRGSCFFVWDEFGFLEHNTAISSLRYINHSCAPNCIAEVVTFERGHKIIISSNRRIQRGEEVRVPEQHLDSEGSFPAFLNRSSFSFLNVPACAFKENCDRLPQGLRRQILARLFSLSFFLIRIRCKTLKLKDPPSSAFFFFFLFLVRFLGL